MNTQDLMNTNNLDNFNSENKSKYSELKEFAYNVSDPKLNIKPKTRTIIKSRTQVQPYNINNRIVNYDNRIIKYDNRSIKNNNLPIKDNNRQIKNNNRPIKNNNRLIKNNNRPIENNINNIIMDNRLLHNIYDKYIYTTVSIDSRDRKMCAIDDKCNINYISTNGYTIYLNREFKNVISIELIDVQFKNNIPAINKCNNVITWIYPTEDDIDELELDKQNLEFPMIDINPYVAYVSPGNYTLSQLEHTLEQEMNSVLHNDSEIYSDENKPHNFNITIDPITKSVTIINRLESLCITSYETKMVAGELNRVDIGIPFFDGGAPPVECDPSFPFYEFSELKLIPTELPNIGGIVNSLVNIKEYMFVDSLPLPGTGGPFYRCLGFDPTPVTGAPNGQYKYGLYIYDKNDNPVNSINTELINIADSSITGKPHIGRGLPFLLSNCQNSILPMLGWHNLEQQSGLVPNFSSIQVSPIKNKMDIEYIGDCKYMFRGDEYIFLRLGHESFPIDRLGNNMIKASSNCVNNNKTNNLFAKIILDRITGNLSTRFIANKKVFYDNTLIKMDNLSIEYIDKNGNLLELNCDHSFTLEIVEKIEVLKETLIDSRTGAISREGYVQ